MSTTILRIDSSARHEASKTRDLADQIISQLRGDGEGRGEVTVIHRDVSDGLPMVNEAWTKAAYMSPDDRSAEQQAALQLSDTLVAELKEADVLVLASPIYNFTVPAALKSWFDQVARANVTFKYTEKGPEGLLKNKRAVVAIASGGTEVGSDADYCSPYIKHFLGFLGIEDVTVVAADQLMGPAADKAMKAAEKKIKKLDPVS